MEEATNIFIGLGILVPLVASVVILLFPRKYAEAWSLLAAVLTLGCTLAVFADFRAGGEPMLHVLEIVPGLAIDFRVDALGMTFAMLASILWIVATFYSYGYVRDNNLAHRRRYFSCFAASIATALGIAYSGNLLTFLLFYEGLTLATYPLVVHKETSEAMWAGRRYLFQALSGGLAVTVGLIWAFALVGSIDFVGGGFLHGLDPAVTIGLFVLLMGGVMVKAAVMPLHAWLPAAMVAPTPVSGLLHAVAVVKAGVFGCMRMLGFTFGPASLDGTGLATVVVIMTAATIVIGSLVALQQPNLKKRLAYSTVVHLSYIVLGAALLTPFAFTGAVLHMVNHGLAKITLFFCAGAIYATAHLTEIKDLKGLGWRMPWTMGAFTVASLGLIGVPGLCGFISKFFLSRGAWEGEQVVAMTIMLGASLLTALYLLPIVKTAYFDRPDEPAPETAGEEAHDTAVAPHEPPHGEARPALLVPLMTTATMVVIFGVLPAVVNVQYQLADGVAKGVFEPTAATAEAEQREESAKDETGMRDRSPSSDEQTEAARESDRAAGLGMARLLGAEERHEGGER